MATYTFTVHAGVGSVADAYVVVNGVRFDVDAALAAGSGGGTPGTSFKTTDADLAAALAAMRAGTGPLLDMDGIPDPDPDDVPAVYPVYAAPEDFTDGDMAILAWDATAEKWTATSGIELGYAEITTSWVKTGASINTPHDIDDLTWTLAVAVARPIKVRVYLPTVTHSVASGAWQLKIYEGATQLQGPSGLTPATAGAGAGTRIAEARIVPSVGVHTYKAAAQTATAGNLTAIAGTASPAFIEVLRR